MIAFALSRDTIAIMEQEAVSLNSAQRKTLDAIFAGKVMRFAKIESLLRSLNCMVREGDGSAVGFIHRQSGQAVRFHRPHPGNEAKDYHVRDARNFLAAIGVTPETVKG